MWLKKVMTMSIPERANGRVGLVVGLGNCCRVEWGLVQILVATIFFRSGVRGEGFCFCLGFWGFGSGIRFGVSENFLCNYSQLQT
jgi:hypothetical protein